MELLATIHNFEELYCKAPPKKGGELDAIYAHLYVLTRREARYILEPQEVYGEDFPGETLRVLKNNEITKFGEYPTLRLVVEARDRMGF